MVYHTSINDHVWEHDPEWEFILYVSQNIPKPRGWLMASFPLEYPHETTRRNPILYVSLVNILMKYTVVTGI